MAASEHEVRHAATLAGLDPDAGRIATLVQEVQGLLGALVGLRKVGTRSSGVAVGIGAGGMPLRADEGAPYHMARPLAALAPVDGDGRILRTSGRGER